MKNLISAYGAITGVIIILGIITTIELNLAFQWLGYLIMFIAFSAIFVAIKQYRDESLGGVITFGTAFVLGLGIAAVAGVVYVLVWEIYLFFSGYDYMADYVTAMIEQQRNAGASEAEIANYTAEMNGMEDQYNNPLFRLPITFLEVFPPGFLVSLVSAFALKSR